MNMFKRIDHIEIVPTNMEKSIEFYTKVLGFKVLNRHKVDAMPLEEVVYLKLNDTMLELLKVKCPRHTLKEQWQTGIRGFALEVEDMGKAVEYLKSKGIGITWGPMDLGEIKRAEIKDPDELIIELRQWK